jgi:HD-GYP domain-containing protein (c-di-GMP phosphodiesterase class II)
LQVGQVLEQDVYDDQRVLLLTAGSVVTERFIHRVRFCEIHFGDPPANRGRTTSRRPVRASAPLITSSDATLQLDQMIEQSGAPEPPRAARPAPPRLPLPRLREQIDAGVTAYAKAVDQYANVAHDVMHGKSMRVGPSSVMLNQLLGSVERDPSLAMLVMDLKSTPDEYLYQHGLNVALMSMRVATQLGYDRNMVLEAGMAAMFADVGMLSVDHEIRFAPRDLNADERFEIQQHPMHTINRLERAGALSPTGLLIAFQVHERCDQSGYPRKRPEQFIHPLARVVAAADIYCALTCNRPHRRPVSPYVGMTTLLREVQAGRLDAPIVRAVLDSLGLFPVGSYVQLDNGVTARVIRTGAGDPRRPVVVPLDAAANESDVELDLSRPGSPAIVAAFGPDDVSLP